MNIPQIYLVEPYNAYAPKGQKKHWHEIVEEQALMERIIAEQMALQEASNVNNLDISTTSEPTSTSAAGDSPLAHMNCVCGLPHNHSGGHLVEQIPSQVKAPIVKQTPVVPPTQPAKTPTPVQPVTKPIVTEAVKPTPTVAVKPTPTTGSVSK